MYHKTKPMLSKRVFAKTFERLERPGRASQKLSLCFRSEFLFVEEVYQADRKTKSMLSKRVFAKTFEELERPGRASQKLLGGRAHEGLLLH